MKVRETADRFSLLQPGDRVLCALSGGPDSVAMTHALWALAPQLGLTVAAAHFSHGLRPEAAAAERALCRTLCRRLDIPLFCGEGDVAGLAQTQKLGLEEAARQLRYAFLEQMGDNWGADRIATGHNRGDNAETVLFHLMRGTGLRGLCGVPPRRGRIIRPLLETSRGEILHYLTLHQLPFAMDETNLEDGCTRNRIRHQILPGLETVQHGAEKQIAACALRLAAEEDCLLGLAQAALAAETAPGVGTQALCALHPAVQYRVVRCLYETCAPGQTLSEVHIHSVLELCRRGVPSGSVRLPGGVAAQTSGGRLLVAQPVQPTAFLPVLLEPEQPVNAGDWELLLTADPEKSGFVFDRQMLEFPVLARPRQTGDCIPMDPDHRKSVKKLLIECKIPKDIRDSLPILCDNKGVFAVADLRMDRTRDGSRSKNRITLVCRRIKK